MEAFAKNSVHTVRIEGCSSEGMGVARLDGMAVFVQGAIPGELCRIKLLKVLKNAAFAKIEEIIEASPHRQTPDCPHFGRCGGCDFRHVAYEKELELKRSRVDDALLRIGGTELKTEGITPAEKLEGCRNKAIYAVRRGKDGRALTGFYRRRSHDLIAVERCKLLPECCDRAAVALREWMDKFGVSAYDEKTLRGVVRHLLVRTGRAGSMIACVSANADSLPHEQELTGIMREKCPELTGLVLDVNKKPGNVVPAGNFRTIWGSGTLTETLCSLDFQLSPRSFFQVNPPQAEKLYEKAAEFCAPEGKEHVLDLYCGTGTISLVMAQRAEKVTGAEIVVQAVEDAWENAKRNAVENVSFIAGDAADAAKSIENEAGRIDAVIVDPPRKGLSPEVVESIGKIAPKRVVYVSCDPATMARDVKRFAENGYTAVKAQAVDMFPRTANVESVILLTPSEGC